MKIINIEKVIINILNGLYLEGFDCLVDDKKIDIETVEKSIIKYFHLEGSYKSISLNNIEDNIYKRIVTHLENYSSNNIVNSKLSDELKDYLNNCNSKEIHIELGKYMQNKLTNIKVIKYIKELINEKDLYLYDSYNKMNDEESKREIDRITKMLDILDGLDFEINQLGIEHKSIVFDPESFEYNYISPSLDLDKYEITFYKRVLEKLKSKTTRK